MSKQYEYDDVVFVTYFYGRPCMGHEELTARVRTVFDSLQVTNRIAALVHYGNVFVLEDLPHISRVITAPGSFDSTMAALEVLAGEREAKGIIPYDIKLK